MMSLPSPDFGSDVDVFLTFRCGLRCTHCFMGENLGASDMPFGMFQSIVQECARQGTQRITLLGGEPTLYPFLAQAVSEVAASGLHCRVVTNGQRAFQTALVANAWTVIPYVCFSIDGSTPRVHDSIRGKGSFDHLLRSIAMAREQSITFSGIVSVSRRNAADIGAILRLCRATGMEYVNVHYVTNRGFGRQSDVLSVDEWLRLYEEVRGIARELNGMEVRIERTFGERGLGFYCAVERRENLMFLPDGRVFHCMMFIDVPNAHSYRWQDGKLLANRSEFSELAIIGENSPTSCPALPIVNSAVSEEIPASSCAVCIYKKDRLGSETNSGSALDLSSTNQ